MGLFDGDPICRFCGVETETVQHIICCCEAVACQCYNVFGRPTVEPKDISTASVRDLCLFIRGAGLLWLCRTKYWGCTISLRLWCVRCSKLTGPKKKKTNLDARWGGWQRHLYYPRERPGTDCIRGWVDPRVGLDECGKARPSSGFDLRTVQAVASRYTD